MAYIYMSVHRYIYIFHLILQTPVAETSTAIQIKSKLSGVDGDRWHLSRWLGWPEKKNNTTNGPCVNAFAGWIGQQFRERRDALRGLLMINAELWSEQPIHFLFLADNDWWLAQSLVVIDANGTDMLRPRGKVPPMSNRSKFATFCRATESFVARIQCFATSDPLAASVWNTKLWPFFFSRASR